MSYYFVIVGTRDNPLYTADLASKPSTSSGAASFFSSSSSSSSNQQSSLNSASQDDSIAGGASQASSGGLFGFGGALGALAGGLSSSSASSRTTGGGSGSAAGASGGGAGSEEGKGIGFGRYNDKHVLQMIAHSSLDVVEDKQFTNGLMYMKAVDRINEWTTSAFLVPGNVKFLILHEHKHDDGIRNFFLDIWELWVKIVQNPFHDLNAPIISQSFDTKVKASARKHL
ncbi:Sedlin [Microstroma glucosiphilum]|uniref:Sedlin n=1 Tax=Pseudomicrostroma glucosiphilum TaxID=1684307 RepID=A0A316UC05_9BASI|nr:Sedlin [Pseudomicrostroma glucosiphilum]PWN22709.1 Sedlin [Pseudomicrostroma glucosiphilum]